MSHLPQERVFNGFWIDHTHGYILGATITTTSNKANVIVAIVSVLIAFAGSHLWDIIAYLSFAACATTSSTEKLHDQQQFLLRNVVSPAAFLMKNTQLYWQRRKHAPGWTPLIHLDMFALVATVCSIGFIAAGVLSSQIVSTYNNDVLASSPLCGFTAQAPGIDPSYANQAIQESIRYAHDCYNESSSIPACQIYKTTSIPFNTSYDTCPFQDMCTLINNQALKMDTGLLWSDDIFGINTRHSSALAIRQVTRCAPLNLSEYERTVPMDNTHSQVFLFREPLPGEMMVLWDIGPWEDYPFNDTMFATSAVIDTLKTYTFSCAWWWKGSVDKFQTSPWFVGGGFDPIQSLQKTEGDLTILSIGANKLTYSSPVDDPFFAAHDAQIYRPGINDSIVYGQDNAAGNMGCTQQYQFCTVKYGCTDLTYLTSAAAQAAALELDPVQNVTLYIFANALINFSTGFAGMLSADVVPLLANDGGMRELTPGLPPDQWELEVKYWTAIILATLQKLVADFAAGQGISGKRFDSQVNLPAGPYEKVLCHAQKMKAPNGISNINVFGLSITVGLCGAIVLINFTLPWVLRRVSAARKKPWIFVEQWDQEELLRFWNDAYAARSRGVDNEPPVYNISTTVANKTPSTPNSTVTDADTDLTPPLDGSSTLEPPQHTVAVTSAVEEQSHQRLATPT